MDQYQSAGRARSLNADAGCVRGVEDNIRLDAARIRMVRRGMLVAAGLGHICLGM